MKVLDAPSQIINVRKTTSQCQKKHQVRQTKHQVRQTKHQVHQVCNVIKTNVNFHTKILIYAVLSQEIFVANSRTLWRTFYRPKKYGGVPKMTIIRYAGYSAD